MKKYLKKGACIFFSAVTVLSTSACMRSSEGAQAYIKSQFDDLNKVSFSEKYYELSAKKTNRDSKWRQGMVSGNGLLGYVTSSSPYSDSFIFQNMHFILPNKNARTCPETFDELETVKQSIVNGKDITDNASYDDVYRYHPGGQLRLDFNSASESDYVRYTDYETAQTGVHFKDKNGEWNRTAFTSFADNATIIKIGESSEGSKVNLTLSYDDISTLANFGDSDETQIKYKKLSFDGGDALAMATHYPSYKNSELKDGGYATLTYIITQGGEKKEVSLKKQNKEEQYIGDKTPGIEITNAESVYLITLSDRVYNIGTLKEFEKASSYDLTDILYNKAKAVADKYTQNGEFDYYKALSAHLAVYQPQFNAVTLNLDGASSDFSNEKLLKLQKGKDDIRADVAQKTYYAGRYAYLSCSGYSTSRLYGMWTGEWNAGWGSKYTMDANVNLQTSSMNTGNISSSPVGYAYFILRQLPDWEENAYATHGFKDAIQAPVNTDGDKAVITETCYPYPFRYWNAGASWMIQPLYETLLCYGNINIPLSDEFNLNMLKSVLSPAEADLTDAQIKEITDRGYLRLQEDILLPMLIKSANYWSQLMTPEYYTDESGKIYYEKGKTTLAENETYCILPSYSPENNPANYASPSAANCAIDIAACRDNLNMLMAVLKNIDPNADVSKYQQLSDKLPPYLYDETNALKEWATTEFEENNEHRHLSHLYCVWPLFETQNNEKLKSAAIQAISNRQSENEASHALVHRSLIAARLKDRASLTDALTSLMNHKIRYDSLMTNHDYDRGSCYCTDFAIGYLGIINESLVFSNQGEIELLPALPESGFNKGSITGIKARTRATVTNLEWDLDAKTIKAQITSDIEQEIKISTPFSSKEQKIYFAPGETVAVEFSIDK